MTVASLVVGICGVVLASLSLAWQAANYVLTGGRVKVTLLVGTIADHGMMTSPPDKLDPGWLRFFSSDGELTAIVAVKVANVGRQPVTVARWALKYGPDERTYPTDGPVWPVLPRRLEVGESDLWAIDLMQALHFVQSVQKYLDEYKTTSPRSGLRQLKARVGSQRTRVMAEVELADGRSTLSRGVLGSSWVASANQLWQPRAAEK